MNKGHAEANSLGTTFREIFSYWPLALALVPLYLLSRGFDSAAQASRTPDSTPAKRPSEVPEHLRAHVTGDSSTSEAVAKGLVPPDVSILTRSELEKLQKKVGT